MDTDTIKSRRKRDEARGPLTALAEVLSPRFPLLKKKLTLANIHYSPTVFLERVLLSTLFVSLGLLIATAIFFLQTNTWFGYLIIPLIVYPIVVFKYLMLYPDALIIKRRRAIDYELVFAGRHMVIALKSGMPLFDSLVGVRKGYGEVSKEFDKIVEMVTLGTPLSQAIREVAAVNPSQYFVRILMQIANSLSSGADVGESLEVVLNQISEEQKIQLKEYGQKLTPIVMFFMVFGIIMPSIGIVLITVIFSVLGGGKVTSSILILIAAFITITQLLFVGLIESSRPKYLM